MKYWEDFNDKYGFHDGGAIPPDAEAVREVYVRAINAVAERRNSNVRVIPFDRPGVHNWCLVFLVTAEEFAIFPDNVKEGKIGLPVLSGLSEAIPDDAFHAALEELMEYGLDQFVETKVRILKCFQKFIGEAGK